MDAETFAFDSRLDGDFLNSIYEDDKEHAEMVFEKFLTSIRIQLNEIDECYSSGDAEMFRKQIHKLKPVLSFVGLTKLTSKAALIEDKCKDMAGTGFLSELYTGFKKELNEMIPVIENDLIKLKA
jgi:HPt (histidine-containing phosphotransfer) domain-containing protein